MTEPLPLRWQLRAAVAAAAIPPLLRFVSFARVVSWLGRDAERGRACAGDALDDAALARWVDSLLRRLPGLWRHTCLKRAAVLYHVLRRAGRPVELWIGVRREQAAAGRGKGRRSGGAVAAHAWLVREGAPYLEPESGDLRRHAVIARFPEGEGQAA